MLSISALSGKGSKFWLVKDVGGQSQRIMSYPSVESGGKCQQLFFFANFAEVWEIKQRVVLDMAADRGAYIDQSQSLILVQSWNLSVQWDVGCSILQVQQHSKEMVCNGAMQLFLVSSTLSVSLYFTLKLHHWFP